MGAVIAGIGIVFGLTALYSFRVPRVRWAWSYHAAMLCLGILFVNGVGALVEWDLLTGLCIIFPGTKSNRLDIL